MKTQPTPISELNPGDKILVEWPADRDRPDWWKLPEVLTVKRIEQPNTILVKETGGLCLQASEFHLIIDQLTPEAGDKITFTMDWYNESGFKIDKEFTAQVNNVSRDPMKVHPPKCIVTIEGEHYGITFDMITNIDKPQSKKVNPTLQLELF